MHIVYFRNSKIALNKHQLKQVVSFLLTKVVQNFYSLQVVPLLVLQKHLKGLKHLDEVISLVEQVD